MTTTLTDKFDSEHIRREVREFEAKFEKIDDESYRMEVSGGEIIEPVVGEELIEKASQYLRQFTLMVREEDGYELDTPKITPYEGGIDFFWPEEDRPSVLLHVGLNERPCFAYDDSGGEMKSGELN